MNREVGTGSGNVGKHTGRATENVILYFHALVDRNIILDAYAITNSDIVTDIDILAKGAVLTKTGTFLHMAEMPYLCSLAYLYILVNVT
jgi:hypothetical protein